MILGLYYIIHILYDAWIILYDILSIVARAQNFIKVKIIDIAVFYLNIPLVRHTEFHLVQKANIFIFYFPLWEEKVLRS